LCSVGQICNWCMGLFAAATYVPNAKYQRGHLYSPCGWFPEVQFRNRWMRRRGNSQLTQVHLNRLPLNGSTNVGWVVCSVAENESENKMSLQNLATVFGPTVLRPAVKGSEVQTMEELFSSGTRDAMMQTSILMTFLNLRKKGAEF